MLLTTTALLLLTLAIACGGRPETPEEYVTRVQTWRSQHETSYRTNWATIAGLHFLTDGRHAAGSQPSNAIVIAPSVPDTIGDFVVEGTHVRFEPSPGVPVHHNGTLLAGPVDLRDTSDPPADELSIGPVRMVVHRSGSRAGLRVWDPEGPIARGFSGFSWFDIDPSWAVTGRFIPDPAPRTLRVTNTFGDTDDYPTEGVVEFTVQGQTHRLRPFTTRPDRFFFVFRDATSGEETYEAARFLYADLQGDGTVPLDFNMAYNPPCAFNPYTTCPIPLPENVLPMAVVAGERDYAGPRDAGDLP